MHYHLLSLLSMLATGPLRTLATPLQPHWGATRVMHAWNAVPTNWERLGHPAADTTIDLYIALKSQREDALVDALYEVSSPGHPKYGAHLSREQVSELVAPHPDTLELIHSWLEHHSVPSSSVSTSHGGSWLTLTGVPVSQANALLGTTYHLYQHVETKDCVLRTLSYALPAVLHAHVQTVAPTTYFDSPHTLQQIPRKLFGGAAAEEFMNASALSSRVDELVTPSDLRWLYSTIAYVPAATDRNVLATVGYFGDYPSPGDLTTFMNQYRTDGADATFTFVPIGSGDREFHQEGNTNIQIAEGIAYPTPHKYYSIVGALTTDLTWLNYMVSQPDVPQTISSTYGGDEQEYAEGHATAMCNLYAQLGARGASVITASGNGGVGRGDCKVNDGSDRVQFLPTFPPSCPWITSVGGTFSSLPEVAWPGSQGGFSNYFKRPAYQDNAVPFFLRRLGNKHDGLYNALGRGFPDIAAQARDFAIIINDATYIVTGTSCSSPTVAGVISLLNDYLLSRGKPPLGWLNPWLYGTGRAGLNDIMSGSNPGCNTDGFTAIPGWDPVTGLGTPDFLDLQRRLRDR